jgi:pimeloyl-ACP methyl ester carboxylesterase
MKEGERLSYDWTLGQAKNANDKQAIKTLNEIGEPPYKGKWQKKLITERRFLGKFGGEVYGSSKGAFSLVIGRLIRSTEYSLHDKVNFLRGIFKSIRLIWPELLTINLIEQAASLKVPVYFVLGKHDYEVPFKLAEQYFEIIDAPHKELIWFENSSHFPNIEENEKFIDLLVNRVLKAAFINM